MEEGTDVVVRCRALIIHEGKLMVVKHPHDTSFAAFPGGKLERGEHVHECMRRELIEELGVEPVLGKLQYVYTFVDKGKRQSVEFFFHVENAADFVQHQEAGGTHAHEIEEILWVDKDTEMRVLPEEVFSDFKSGTLIADEVRYARG